MQNLKANQNHQLCDLYMQQESVHCPTLCQHAVHTAGRYKVVNYTGIDKYAPHTIDDNHKSLVGVELNTRTNTTAIFINARTLSNFVWVEG